MNSFDFKLAGQPYIGPANGTAIQLGAALTEPAKPSEVGSIIIASFHGGIGRAYDDGVLRYAAARDVDVTIPGEVKPGYSVQTVDSETPSPVPSTMRPMFAFFPGLSTLAFMIAGQQLWSFDPANPTALTELTRTGDAWPSNSEFSGSAFLYNQTMVLGITNTSTPGKPEAYATVALASPTTYALEDSIGISYGASGRARAFWIEEDSANVSSTALRWAPMVAGATFKGGGSYTEQPTTGPGIELGFPRVSWATLLGSSLVLMREDGAILGGDEKGIISIAGQVPLQTVDRGFGRGATLYHDGILIPGQQGLWSFDLRSLTLRPASPNYVQGEAEERLRGPISAIGSMGPYSFFAQRQTDQGGVSGVSSIGYKMVRYSNRIAVHDMIERGAANEVIVAFLPYYDSAERFSRLFYIVYNESTNACTLKYLPLRLPNDQTVSETNLTTSAEIDLNHLAGPSPASNMTKVWTQIRGFFDNPDDAATLEFEGFQFDGQTAVVIADVTADGAFAVPITSPTEIRRVGRELTGGTVKLTDPTHLTGLPLPLIIDYVWVPNTQDAVTLKGVVSSEVLSNTGSMWTEGVAARLQTILDLRGTVQTLELPSPDTPDWTVFVEGVQLDREPAPSGEGQDEYVVTFQVRRLS